MYTLAFNPSLGAKSRMNWWGAHDPSACLLEDDEIVAIAEEERFNRMKRSPQTFPTESVQWVLEEAEISISDVDVLAIARDPRKRVRLLKQTPRKFLPSSPDGLFSLFQEIATAASSYASYHEKSVSKKLSNVFTDRIDATVYSIPHHRCHAASAVYCSPFDRPICLTVDGHGEYDSTVLWTADMSRKKVFSYDNSVGGFYSEGVKYLGYRDHRDAGKVMGLAPYGSYDETYEDAFDELISVGSDSYDVTPVTQAEDPIGLFERRFGPRRVYPNEFEQHHKDFAYHLQLEAEKIVTNLVRSHVRDSGVTNVALAGGVAMNCKMNRSVLDMDCVDDLFVQPAANDSGLSLGAALEAYRLETGDRPDVAFDHVYYGPSYSHDRIEAILEEAKLEYTKPDDICSATASLLARGKLVGWYQGRMEYGARALGNRSILADPRDERSLDKVNKNVKHREPWRPFAPSLLYEAREEYLSKGDEAPFMIVLDGVKEDKRDEIPAVVHVDGTTRPQTVREETNERYHRLLGEFEAQTGVPVLLNTSFNVAGEPIVESPQQAIQDFYATGLDALALGDVLLQKPASKSAR